MLLELLCAFGLLATSFGSPHFKKTTQHASTRGLTVRTSSGIVQGFVNKTAPDVRQFLGVPYAKPPVGNLRFAPPEAATASKSIIHATSLPDSCMQQYSNSSTIYTEYEHEFLISGGQSEDCLYVSIWAPSLESIEVSQAPVPVFVYIPGGGFTSGGQNSMYKIPDTWVQRTQSHIVVIMNYRVNVFGFPNAAGLRTQNLGLLDQRMVVEWVQKNIGAFGGDPTRIVLWGQSAGGTSVAMYPYAWTEDPIVAGLIADSGSAGSINGADTAHTNFTSLAGMVGCGGLSSSAEVACVRNVPAQRLEDALSLYGESGKLPALRFTPTPDGVVVFSNYTERLLSGELAQTVSLNPVHTLLIVASQTSLTLPLVNSP